MDLERLAPFAVLSTLSDEERAEVAAVASEITAETGTKFTQRGEFGYHLYFIEDGEVEVSRDGETIASLGAGDHFGEIAMLVTGTRTADVQARSEVRLIVVFDQDLRRLLKSIPALDRALREASGSRMPPRR